MATGSPTHAPIDGEQKTAFGGATDLNYVGKHFGFDTHFDHFGKNFRNTDLGFLNGRPNKNWLYGGLRVSAARSVEVLQELDAVFYANKQWTEDGLTIFENINWWTGMRLQNYWNCQLRRRPQLRVPRRSRHARRAADREAGEETSTSSTSTPTRASDGASGFFVNGNQRCRGRLGQELRHEPASCSRRAGFRPISARTTTRARDSAPMDREHGRGRRRRRGSTSTAG